MRVVLDPPRGIQADGHRLTIGMTRHEMRDQLSVIGEVVTFRRGDRDAESLMATTPTHLAVFAYVDAQGVVNAIEVARPSTVADRVEFRGVDVFGPAERTIAELLRVCELDVDVSRCMPTAPGLMLGLWRDGPDDAHFETVIVAEPGDDAHVSDGR